MKKRLLLILILLIGWFVIADNAFPDFPMTLYGDIKIWTTDVSAWTLKIYNSSDTELASFDIVTAWKYWTNLATETHLLLNKFEWNLVFKLTSNWRNYLINSIDDSNRWEGCPSKDSITFVSANCKYDLNFAEETFAVTFRDSDVPTQNVTYWTVISRPENPERNWHTFEDWYTTTWFTDSFDFSQPITWVTDIYARWVENLVVPTWADAPSLSGSNEDIWAIVVDENVPVSGEEPTDSKDNRVAPADVASGSNTTVTIEWWVEIYPVDNSWNQITGVSVIFTSPIAVKIHVPNGWNGPNWKDYMVKVKHTLDKKYWYVWLTLNPSAQCVDGLVSEADQYKWEVIVPTKIWNQYYVTIYTCSASSFVAYAEVTNTNPSTWWWGWGGGWWWGWWGWDNSKTITTNTWTIANTWTNYTETKTQETTTQKDNNTTTDNSWYQEWNQSEILGNWYSREFNNAYTFAYRNWITTMDSIDKADMNGYIIRSHLAKMLSQYAINVLGKTPDTDKTISFRDVSAELDAEYNNGVTLAYQLGIMWINIEEFRPNDLVTRAEFGTALSRMLFGLADGDGAYYETHLQKLMDEKIITNDNPDLQELRGYVMIMLMRSA